MLSVDHHPKKVYRPHVLNSGIGHIIFQGNHASCCVVDAVVLF